MSLSVRERYAAVAVLSAAAALVVIVILVLTGGHDGDVPGAGARGHADVRLGTKGFRIGGDAIVPLAPGTAAAIDVKVSNPYHDPLRVTRLRVWVHAVQAPNADEDHPCSRRDFAVRQVAPSFAVTVAGRATRSLSRLGVPQRSWPHLRMVDRRTNQDGCKGAALTLLYRGSGSLRR